MPDHVRLGSFYLQAPIGQGGMGEVWRGVHLHQHVPVAIKVLSAEQARQGRGLAAFRREVRAVAQLHHPSIVSVLDYGVIDRAADRASKGRLVAGSPYLVMELAEDTLATRPPAFDWREIRGVLIALLDALAHAHSHGIIHRDLKPANILWVRHGVGYPARLKLSDFGLAHVVTNLGVRQGRGAGTPSYMSPEQFAGAVRDFGPWTDLYALGCLAYNLSSGRRPFTSRDIDELGRMHREELPPPLDPACMVPRGFAAWVMRLLEKQPARRYRSAADAAWALMQLGDPSDELDETLSFRDTDEWSAGDSGMHDARGATEPTKDYLTENAAAPGTAETRMNSETGTMAGQPPMGESKRLTARTQAGGGTEGDYDSHSTGRELSLYAAGPLPVDPPPLPRTWRRPQEPIPTNLLGAGLGLYGLRAIPIEGRVEERDVMWDALRRVGETGAPELIILRGPSGYGKSRLAEWFVQRAAEIGAAHVLTAQHEPHLPPGAVLARMAVDHLRTRGLERPVVRDRLRQLLKASGALDMYELEALTELVSPATSPDDTVVRLVQPRTRYALLKRLVERAAFDRPAILRLEDAQWGADSLAFVEHTLASGPLPALFIATVQDEVLNEDSAAAERLELLLERDDVRLVTVGALPRSDHHRLVGGLLRLEGELTDRIAKRTAGNPLFAVQLVKDWVQRGVLELSDEGFALKQGEAAVLPDDLHAVWSARIDRLVGDDPHARAALELAAVTGLAIDGSEWEASCRAAALNLPPHFVDHLLTHHIVTLDPASVVDRVPSFRFVHGMLRECLVRNADESHRLGELHSVVADALLPRFATGEAEVAERLAAHLQAAGRLDAAFDPLRAAVRLAHQNAEYGREEALLDLLVAICDQQEFPPAHEERVHGAIARAALLWRRGSLEPATSLAAEALAFADESGQIESAAAARCVLANILYHRDQAERAEELLIDALQSDDLRGDDLSAARSLRGLALISFHRGRDRLAFNAFLSSLELCRVYDEPLSMAASLVGMGFSDPESEAGNLGFLEEALALFETVGDLFGVATTLDQMGDVARREERFDDAAALYRRALEISRQIGASFHEVQVTSNLARVAVAQEEYYQAKATLDLHYLPHQDDGHRAMKLAIRALYLAVSAGLGHWEEFDRHHDWYRRSSSDGGVFAADAAWALELAGAICLDAKQPERARAVWDLAADQWERGGRDDRMFEIGAKIGAITQADRSA